MKHLKLNYLLIAAVLITVLASCHKNNDTTPVTPTAQRAGVYILNQGNYGKTNASLTYYDYTSKTLTPDIFSSVNSRALGSTANDAEVYGSKIYIAVDQSGTVEVIDRKTAKSLKTISFLTAGVSREPRDIAFYNGNAFITLYDGNVAVMDTSTYTVSTYIPVGRNPEQAAVANGKLYVANGGGLSYPNVDKTVSVINLSTLKVTSTLTVGSDPYAVSVDSYGDVFVAAYGVYGTSNATLSVINSTTDVVTSTTNYSGGAFSIVGDNAYYLSNGQVLIYNVKTGVSTTTNFITDGTVFSAAYAIAADSLTGEVFVTDALNYTANGLVYAFDKTGKKEYSLATGIDPGTIVLVNK